MRIAGHYDHRQSIHVIGGSIQSYGALLEIIVYYYRDLYILKTFFNSRITRWQ